MSGICALALLRTPGETPPHSRGCCPDEQEHSGDSRRIRVPARRTWRDGFRTAVPPLTAVRRDSLNAHWRCVIMTRTRLPRQARGRWAWLAAAATAAVAAGVLAVRHSTRGRDQAESTAVGTEPAQEMAPGAAGIRTRLPQARTAAISCISAAGSAARRKLFREGRGAAGEPETAETTSATVGTPAAAAPEQDEAPPGDTGNGSAAPAPAADALPPHDR
jgi:hypothetical protein